jgi:hypothetical protein
VGKPWCARRFVHGMNDEEVARLSSNERDEDCDIDLKDGKHGRVETTGVAAMIEGIVASCPKDEERLERGFALFDGLLTKFAKSDSRRKT